MMFLIYAIMLVFATAQEDKCSLFECNPTDFNEVTLIIGLDKFVGRCPADQKCNQRLVPPCNPCIPDNCDDVFTCDGQIANIIGSSPMECGTFELCNDKAKEPCNQYCTDVICEGGFRCIDSLTYFDEMIGVEDTCSPGTICNIDNKIPCTPCIRDDNPTTTTTSTTTTPKTTTRTTTRTTTTPRPFVTPNCNDGFGFSTPCRAGPVGFYFRCRRSGFTYQTQRLSCDNINSDFTCRNAWVCLY